MSGAKVAGAEIERLVQLLARLPGLGPRSARRAVLKMIKQREKLLEPLAVAVAQVAEKIVMCQTCGSVDVVSPCTLCRDPRRDPSLLCVVEEVGDLWALERAAVLKGRYHVLGGVLSALDGVGPDDLAIPALIDRVRTGNIAEVVLAMNATVDGQATAHYITDHLEATGCRITRLAHGVPVGGELDYLDEGTLAQAFKARRPL
ncbi:MAG: recombination mediator RecR [Alphaproteobacteria bacterium]